MSDVDINEEFAYDLWGRKFNVGDIVVPTDGTKYKGKIIYISKDKDVVEHQCLSTGKIWKKSYTGFGIRYQKYA